MLTSVCGVYRGGKVELTEQPGSVLDGSQVIVTFLPSDEVDLRYHGINEAQAAELRGRLAAFGEDWDAPEMDVYDHYEANQQNG
jgi:hypothetical protein